MEIGDLKTWGNGSLSGRLFGLSGTRLGGNKGLDNLMDDEVAREQAEAICYVEIRANTGKNTLGY